jgi:hypothetical protein
VRLEQNKGQIKAGVIRAHSDNGFNLADTGNLIRTCEIEAVLAALVIAVSLAQRRRCRLRRAAPLWARGRWPRGHRPRPQGRSGVELRGLGGAAQGHRLGVG